MKSTIPIPKNEELCTRYMNKDDELVFVVTRDLFGTTFFLYKIIDGKIKKLGKAASPFSLEEKYDVVAEICK